MDDDEVNLSEILDELNDSVEAVDTASGDYVSGTCKWVGGGKTVSKDGKYSFSFTPDDSSYKSVTGSIQIYLEGSYGELTIRGIDEAEKINPKQGDSISSYNSELNDCIYAEDDEGNEVEGKAKFTQSGKFERSGEKSYQVTFTPKDTKRYEKKTFRIDIVIEEDPDYKK